MRLRTTAGERWTDEETEALEQMKASGLGYKRIAAVLDRTRDAVRSRWRELIGEGRQTRQNNESAKRQARRLRGGR
jgi:hypothetical protein